MTSENHDINNAVEMITALVNILTDPTAAQKLKKLQATVAESVARAQGEPDFEHRKWPVKGTCPTCKKPYTFRDDGSLRRHGKGKCYTDRQLPSEIIPAIRAIALGQWAVTEFTGDHSDFGVDSGGRTQDDSDSGI